MSAIDDFSSANSYANQILSPITDAAAVSPSDTVDLPHVSRIVYVGGAGDLKITLLSGQTVTLGAVPAGTQLPWRVSRVYATGTTATNIVVGW